MRIMRFMPGGTPCMVHHPAFLRTIIPYGITLIIVHIAPDKVLYAFVASLMPVFFITDWLIMRRLSATFISIPYWRNILLYVKSLVLGLVGLGQYMIGLGLMLLSDIFFQNPRPMRYSLV